LQYICKLDREKLGEYKNKIITEEVVLTAERIKHIKERHPRRFWTVLKVYGRCNKKTWLCFRRY